MFPHREKTMVPLPSVPVFPRIPPLGNLFLGRRSLPSLILPHTERRQQPQQDREIRTSQSQTQETLHRIGNRNDNVARGTILKCKDFGAEGQTVKREKGKTWSQRHPPSEIVLDWDSSLLCLSDQLIT